MVDELATVRGWEGFFNERPNDAKRKIGGTCYFYFGRVKPCKRTETNKLNRIDISAASTTSNVNVLRVDILKKNLIRVTTFSYW